IGSTIGSTIGSIIGMLGPPVNTHGVNGAPNTHCCRWGVILVAQLSARLWSGAGGIWAFVYRRRRL
ncbi:MAG: hypothetical protein AAB528_03655, partial [Chloroflexota bacterium]